jgi:hypothetical protein
MSNAARMHYAHSHADWSPSVDRVEKNDNRASGITAEGSEIASAVCIVRARQNSVSG